MISTIRKQQKRKARQPASNGTLEPFKFIVTGFNSFGKNLENPSGLAAQSLPGAMMVGHHPVEIDSLLLETCCKSSWASVKKSLGSKPKALALLHSNGNGHRRAEGRTVLILMGLAATREALNLERLALNLRDYPIKDNNGHQYSGEEILPGPLAIKTEYPLQELKKKLLSKGFPCTISNHAGSFVCNDLYYQSLTFQQTHGTPDLVLFIHVPKAHIFARAVREKGSKNLSEFTGARISRTKQIELLNKAIVEVIKFSVAYLEKKKPESQSKKISATASILKYGTRGGAVRKKK